MSRGYYHELCRQLIVDNLITYNKLSHGDTLLIFLSTVSNRLKFIKKKNLCSVTVLSSVKYYNKRFICNQATRPNKVWIHSLVVFLHYLFYSQSFGRQL